MCCIDNCRGHERSPSILLHALMHKFNYYIHQVNYRSLIIIIYLQPKYNFPTVFQRITQFVSNGLSLKKEQYTMNDC